LLFIILRLVLWPLSFILSSLLPFILAFGIFLSVLYFFVWPHFQILSLSLVMSYVPSLVSGMWCSTVGLGCYPPVMTEEKFTEVMSPQFDVAVDLFDHLVKVEELQKTADFEKR